MGATNTTTHYNLSQFVSTDKPAWLQDYNGDMLKIDAGIDEAKVAADTAQTTANAANGAATQAASDITALGTTVTGQGNNITALQLAVNTINSLIGNGTPTTTDQTIIGAINEINAALNWKTNSNLHGAGSASISLPSTFRELLIEVHYTVSNLAWTFHVVADELSSTTKYLLTGSASGVGSNTGIALAITSSSANIADAKVDNTSVVASCEITVYYR